jgi:hypothetical protein
VFDYLAEVTMSILAGAARQGCERGLCHRLRAQVTMKALLPESKAKGIRVVANAGGVNPLACRDALAKVAAELGVDLRRSAWCWATTCRRARPSCASVT